MENAIYTDGENELTKFDIKLIDIDGDYKIFNVFAKNELVRGNHDFWVSINNCLRLKKELERIIYSLNGEVIILDSISDAFLKIMFIDDVGHIKVSGQLGNSTSDDFVVFSIFCDQTILPLLIEKLESESIEN